MIWPCHWLVLPVQCMRAKGLPAGFCFIGTVWAQPAGQAQALTVLTKVLISSMASGSLTDQQGVGSFSARVWLGVQQPATRAPVYCCAFTVTPAAELGTLQLVLKQMCRNHKLGFERASYAIRHAHLKSSIQSLNSNTLRLLEFLRYPYIEEGFPMSCQRAT
jgi:hypothetical protein